MERKHLVSGFQYGFRLRTVGEAPSSICQNHKSATDNPVKETKCLRKTESYPINSLLRTLLFTGLGRLGTLEKLFFSTGCFTRAAWELMGASADLLYGTTNSDRCGLINSGTG
jgi:hypothetical protein